MAAEAGETRRRSLWEMEAYDTRSVRRVYKYKYDVHPKPISNE
jgi:hypothetical protein